MKPLDAGAIEISTMVTLSLDSVLNLAVSERWCLTILIVTAC